MICFVVTTDNDLDFEDTIKLLIFYRVYFKIKADGGITLGKAVTSSHLFIIPRRINNNTDYRLCEMAFQMNYHQVPQSGSNIHFHGKI
jgi:hypothetical protein